VTWIASTAHPAAQRCWGQECIVYDIDSGNTHLVTPLAAEVLRELQNRPCNLETLVEVVLQHSVNDAEPPALSEMQTALSTILDDLARIDLIRWSAP